MNNLKIVQLIDAIPRKDAKIIGQFIHNNFNSDLFLLFDILSSTTSTTEKEVWSLLYPTKKFNKRQLSIDCHLLLKAVEQAIYFIHQKGNDLSFYEILSSYLVEHNMLNHFHSTEKKVTKLLESNRNHADFPLYNHQLEYHKFKALEKESSRKSELNISQASASLDEYYILLKLRYYCAALSHKQVKSSDYEIDFIELLIPQIEQSKLIDSPLIACYLQIQKMLKQVDDDTHFLTLKEQLKVNESSFSAEELNEIYIYPINFCIQKINSGQINYTSQLLDLYKSSPSLNVNSEESISPWRFKNIVDLALMSGDYEWTDYFIANFAHRLRNEFRDNAIAYNTAKLRFYQKDFSKVIELLIDVEYQDAAYTLICKLLLLKTYYETNELEAFYSLLESFRFYILRSKELTAKNRKMYLDLLSIMRKLAKMEYASPAAIDKFKNKIKVKDIITDKAWILEKLEEL